LRTLEVKEHEIAFMFCDIVLQLYIIVQDGVSSSLLFGLYGLHGLKEALMPSWFHVFLAGGTSYLPSMMIIKAVNVTTR
jgi:hypothetical protein